MSSATAVSGSVRRALAKPTDRGQLIAGNPNRRKLAPEASPLASADPAATLGRVDPVEPLPPFKHVDPRVDSFHALQEWEGEVTGIEGDTFFAQLVDITAGDRSFNEEAELPVSDLDPSERERLTEGAIFRMVIGYAKTAQGQRWRTSKIYFRRTGRARGDLSTE